MSTIDPLAARRFAERLAEKGVAMVDAPVSGGTHGAVAGTLSVIVGGPEGFRALVLHGEGGAPLRALGLEGAPGVAAVIGPEGGLTPEELAACERAGALRASLGPRTLRAETAAIAVVALLQGLVGDLG
jgi:16S rRNA (uracil1498-N3)-methyltransferase